MEKTYSIGALAALCFLSEAGHGDVSTAGYECAEGKADMVCAGAESATLVFLSTKRRRGDGVDAPAVSAKKLSRIAMCYLVEHPGVSKLSCDVLSVTIGKLATVTVSATEGAYTWEHEG